MAEEKKITLKGGNTGKLVVDNDKVTIEIPNPKGLKLTDFDEGSVERVGCGDCEGTIEAICRII